MWFELVGDLLGVGFSLKQTMQFCAVLLPKYEQQFKRIDIKLQEGQYFAEGVRDYVQIDTYYQLLIAEKHGNLAECVNQLAEYLAVKNKQISRLKGLLMYPAILVGLLVSLMIVMKIFIFPEIQMWHTKSTAPWQIGGVDVKAFLIIVSTFTVIGLIYNVHQAWHRRTTLAKIGILARLPIIGKMFCQYYGYYLISNLALLLKSGMGLKEICALFQTFAPESILFQLSGILDRLLVSGNSPAKMVGKYPYLPQELVVFLNKGTTGIDLGKQLQTFSMVLFTRLTKQVEKLLILVQPILFGGIAIAIVSMYLSIMLPIYQSMKGIY